MNGFLWLGIACTAVLIVAIVVDGLDDAIDALDMGPSWLSLPVIAAFGGAFGFVTGALVDTTGSIAAMGIGTVAGVGFAAVTVRFSSAFMDMPTDPTETQGDLLGSIGRIVEPPAHGRYGAALLQRPAGPLKVACIAPTTIATGTEIVVVDVTSSTLVTVEVFDPEGIGAGPT